MAAEILIEQSGQPAGVPGRSRSDGIAGITVTVHSNGSGTTHNARLLWVPSDDTTAVASFTQTGPTTWTFTPQSSTYGTYRIELVVDQFTPTESRQVRTFVVRAPVSGLIVPALNESASPVASLAQYTVAEIGACESNEPYGKYTSGSANGWLRSYEELVDLLETGLPSAPTGTATGDLGGTYPSPTVDGIQGVPVLPTAPSTGDALVFNGTSWGPGPAGSMQSAYDSAPDVAQDSTGGIEISRASTTGENYILKLTDAVNYKTALEIETNGLGNKALAITASASSGNSIQASIEDASQGCSTNLYAGAVHLTGTNIGCSDYAIKVDTATEPRFAVLNKASTATVPSVYITGSQLTSGGVNYSNLANLYVNSTLVSMFVYAGDADPNGALQAAPGSIYLRGTLTGTVGEIYIKNSLSTSTVWDKVQTNTSQRNVETPTTVTSNATMSDANSIILADTTSGNIDLTVYTPSGPRSIWVKKTAGTNQLRLKIGSFAGNIEGAPANYVLSATGSSLKGSWLCVFDGTDWWVLG